MIRDVAVIRGDADGMLVGVVSQTDLIAWHYFTGVDGVPFYSTCGRMIPYEEDSSLASERRPYGGRHCSSATVRFKYVRTFSRSTLCGTACSKLRVVPERWDA